MSNKQSERRTFIYPPLPIPEVLMPERGSFIHCRYCGDEFPYDYLSDWPPACSACKDKKKNVCKNVNCKNLYVPFKKRKYCSPCIAETERRCVSRILKKGNAGVFKKDECWMPSCDNLSQNHDLCKKHQQLIKRIFFLDGRKKIEYYLKKALMKKEIEKLLSEISPEELLEEIGYYSDNLEVVPLKKNKANMEKW